MTEVGQSGGQPAGGVQRPESATLRASLACTPFTGPGRPAARASFADAYFDGERFAEFLHVLQTACQDAGVEVAGWERTLGLYEAAVEPSAAVSVHGTRAALVDVARRLALEFDQVAVRIVFLPGTGVHTSLTWSRAHHDDADTLATLIACGAPGARIFADRIEIADPTPLRADVLAALTDAFGPVTAAPCEVQRVLSRPAGR